METVALLYEDYQKELAEDFKNTFLKRASDTDSSRSNDTVIDEVTDMLSTNIAVYTEKLLQRWGFSSGGEGGGGGDVTVTLDDLLKKYLSDNYVTIKGDQEVFGEKDFRKGIRIAGRRLYWDEGNDALVIEGAAYTTRWLSAKGVSPGGGGAGSGGGGGLINLVYGFESLGGTFDNNDNSATFNAFTINEIWKLASSGLTNVTVTGSGNAVTDVIKGSDGRSLTFTKGSTFATKSEFDALNTKFNDFLTGSDADDIINKWSELEVFLQGMKESDNLAVILQSKMDKTAFSKLFTALDASGNEVDPSDDTKTIASIRANFGFWGVDYISAKGVSKGSGGTGGASTLYQLVDVLANDTEDGVEGAAAGKALVFDGTHWRAGDAGLNESQLYSYLTANKYLTQSAADSRYVTSSRKVIAGTGLSGGGALTSDVTLSLGTSGVVAGTYTKVMVDAYGRVTSGTNLSSTDIPNLDWSKITTGKPTTLAGYGITDAYTKTEADGKYVTIATAQTVSGAKTFSATMKTSSVLPSTDANSALGGTANRWSNVYSVNGVFSQNVTAKLLSASESLQIGDAYLKWDAANNAVYVIKKDGTTPVGFYSTDWLSAKGVSISGVQTGTLADLNDVEITDPVNGQALKYDAASKKWVNGTIDSFNVNQMWAELKKADSSKVIDASHIPTSVLDGRWVKKTGDTMTGTLTSASSSGSIVFKGLENCDITNIYKDNGVIRNDDGGLTSIRNGLRFNWYDTYWYIGNLRGISTDSAGFGVVDHNNKLVLRVTPNDVRAPRFMSTVATGLSPLIVSSNTTVDNLSADLLDGYHAFGTSNALIKYGYTVGGTKPAWCRIATYSIRNTETMTDVCFVLHSAFSDLFGLLVVKTRGTAVVEGLLIVSYNINRSNIRIYHDAEKKNIELYCYGGSNYSIIQANLLYSHDRNGGANTNITLYRADTKAPSWSTYVNPGFVNLQNSSEVAKKLQTPRTLWGQSFDGSANVSGDMTGVGNITMSGQLTSTVASGTAPFIVASNTVVGNLNADLLDGLHAERFLLSVGRSDGTFDLNTYSERAIKEIRTTEQTTNNAPFAGYGLLANLWDSNKFAALQIGGTSTDLFFRGKHNDTNKITSAWHRLLHTENYASIADGRYVKKAGDTMTGDLNISGGHILCMLQTSSTSTQQIHFQGGRNDYGRIAFGGTAENAGWMEIASCDDGNEPIYARQYTGVFTTVKNTLTLLDANGDTVMSNNKGLSVGWGSRQVREGGSWVHGGADAANSDDANLRFGSWMGIGWYPTISGQTVAQGKNAMWLNTRTGVLNVVGGIKESTICIGCVNSSGGYDTAYNGEINRYVHHLFLQCHSGKYLIMCTGGGLAGIGTNSPGEKLHVAGNTRTDGYFKSTVGTGTQPYQCNSTTLNTNLNADLLDGQHGAYYQNRIYDGFVAQYNSYGYIEFLRFVIPSGQNQLRAYVVFDLCRAETGGNMNGRAVLTIRRGRDNNAGCIFYVTNFGRSWLPELRCTTDDGITWRVWMKCVKDSYDPYIAIKIVEQYPYGYVTTQNNGTTGTPGGSKYTFVAGLAGLSNAANIWTNARTFYIQDHNASHTGAGVSVNGSANVYLKLPNSIQCSDWFRSTGKSGWYHQDYGGGIYMQDSTYVRVYGGKRFYVGNTENTNFSTNTAISTDGGIYAKNNITSNANIIANGAITAKASSSDIRLKTDIQGYDAMGIIRKFRSVKYHWNAVAKENSEVFNHDNWNYGLIAQDLLSGGYTQWVKDIFNDYYTIDYERLIPVVWKGLQEVDDEVTKLRKEITRLNKKVEELEKSLCA